MLIDVRYIVLAIAVLGTGLLCHFRPTLANPIMVSVTVAGVLWIMLGL